MPDFLLHLSALPSRLNLREAKAEELSFDNVADCSLSPQLYTSSLFTQCYVSCIRRGLQHSNISFGPQQDQHVHRQNQPTQLKQGNTMFITQRYVDKSFMKALELPAKFTNRHRHWDYDSVVDTRIVLLSL